MFWSMAAGSCRVRFSRSVRDPAAAGGDRCRLYRHVSDQRAGPAGHHHASFYASSNLLAPGLQTYSAELGAVRRNWSVVSNDYGALAASATYRRGLSPILTIKPMAKGQPDSSSAAPAAWSMSMIWAC